MPATHGNAGISAWKCNLKAEIHSYEDAMRFLIENATYYVGGAQRELGPNMLVRKQEADDFVTVRLYDTDIIRYYADATFSVDNGGYNTPTTRERLQMVLPPGWTAYHHQKKLGLWGHGYTHASSAGQSLWPCDHTVLIHTRNPATGALAQKEN